MNAITGKPLHGANNLVFPVAKLLSDRGAGIIFYTGYGDPESLSRDWPSAQILIKPAPPRLLISAVADACCAMVSPDVAPA
jgi:hypothetical protein